MDIRGFAKQRPLLSFFGLAFLFSWVWWGGLFLMTTQSAAVALASPGVLLYALWGAPLVGPALAGVMMSLLVDGKSGVRCLVARLATWRVGAGWYAVALLMAPMLWVMVLLILGAVVSPSFEPRPAQTMVGLLLVPIGGAVSSLLEEIGWTGFALPQLLTRRRAAVAGVMLGIAWAVWHIVINVWAYDNRTDGQALAIYAFGVGTAFLPLIAYRVLIVWVYVNTGKSLLLGWLTHWFLIVGLSVVAPLGPGADLPLANGLFTVALWITMLAVVSLWGATTLRCGPRFRRLITAGRPALP